MPQAAGLRFAGLEEGRLPTLRGVFTVDPEQPVANGRPHYRTAAGGHLYYHSGTGEWVLNDEFTPDKDDCFACLATAGAVPVGAAVWQYDDGEQWVGRELTVAELTAAEVAAAERAAAAAAAEELAAAAAQADRVNSTAAAAAAGCIAVAAACMRALSRSAAAH